MILMVTNSTLQISMAGITQEKLKEAVFPLRSLLKNEKGKLKCKKVLLKS